MILAIAMLAGMLQFSAFAQTEEDVQNEKPLPIEGENALITDNISKDKQ